MKSKVRKDAIVIYHGPSMLNGAMIVALATVRSSNIKTGPMVQSWIVPVEGPLVARDAGADDSVCGECPRRHSLGGTCYVPLFHAPRATWQKWTDDGRPSANWRDRLPELRMDAGAFGVRLGSYGDPTAVPLAVWQEFIAATEPRQVTGYTHQWRKVASLPYRKYVMASADSVEDAKDAHAAGWRYFAALQDVSDAAQLPGSAIECLSTARGVLCSDCGICDGSREGRAVQPASVYIAEHGIRARPVRSSALRVFAPTSGDHERPVYA